MESMAKALQQIARCILSQVCSISSYERNWSMYSFVHNKICNRLHHSRADDLVYVYTNTRLFRHRRGPRHAQWYGLTEVHSNDESDSEDPHHIDPEYEQGDQAINGVHTRHEEDIDNDNEMGHGHSSDDETTSQMHGGI
jgi:hypothetical protein